MTKAELLKMVESYPDNAEIVLWEWTNRGSKFYYLNPILTNFPDNNDPTLLKHPDYIGFSKSVVEYREL